MENLRVFSRHPSHDILRNNKLKFPFLACVRLGSTTPGKLNYEVEINTVKAVEISANKRLMKERFSNAGISTAKWWKTLNDLMHNPERVQFPIVAKNIYGSRGQGNYLLHSQRQLDAWLNGRNVHNYIFERYYAYNREYRLHVTKDGCFYACRKMIRDDVPKDKRWFRNDSNSVWIVEENEKFDKPSNWDVIIKHCKAALKYTGLDIAAFDVRVQSAKDNKGATRSRLEFIIIESNSAPSFGEITSQKYLEILPKLIMDKKKEVEEESIAYRKGYELYVVGTRRWGVEALPFDIWLKRRGLGEEQPADELHNEDMDEEVELTELPSLPLVEEPPIPLGLRDERPERMVRTNGFDINAAAMTYFGQPARGIRAIPNPLTYGELDRMLIDTDTSITEDTILRNNTQITDGDQIEPTKQDNESDGVEGKIEQEDDNVFID
jgi:hypothetical protein